MSEEIPRDHLAHLRTLLTGVQLYRDWWLLSDIEPDTDLYVAACELAVRVEELRALIEQSLSIHLGARMLEEAPA